MWEFSYKKKKKKVWEFSKECKNIFYILKGILFIYLFCCLKSVSSGKRCLFFLQIPLLKKYFLEILIAFLMTHLILSKTHPIPMHQHYQAFEFETYPFSKASWEALKHLHKAMTGEEAAGPAGPKLLRLLYFAGAGCNFPFPFYDICCLCNYYCGLIITPNHP